MYSINDKVAVFGRVGTVLGKSWNPSLSKTVYQIKWGSLTLNNVSPNEMVKLPNKTVESYLKE